MSRRAFMRWLLAIGAALVGLSAWFSQLVKKKFIPEDQPAASSVAAPSLLKLVAQNPRRNLCLRPANVLFYIK